MNEERRYVTQRAVVVAVLWGSWLVGCALLLAWAVRWGATWP
jgi:hypothetical protein